MPRYLITVNEWGTNLVPARVSVTLPTQRFISASDADSAIRCMEDEHGRGATIISAVAIPVPTHGGMTMDEVTRAALESASKMPTYKVREDSPAYGPDLVLAKSRERSKWPNFVVGTNRIDVEQRIYRFRGDGSYVLSLATTDGERVKKESAQMRVRHIVVSVVVEEKIVATNYIVPAVKKPAVVVDDMWRCPLCGRDYDLALIARESDPRNERGGCVDDDCPSNVELLGKTHHSDRVSEGRPVYRVPRRSRLHIEADGGLTYCGEIIALLNPGSVINDEAANIIEYEPKGTCGRCIHYALIEVSQSTFTEEAA